MAKSTFASVAHRIPAHNLMRWAAECLAALEVPDDTALLLAQSFVKLSLFGFDSQGMDRLLQELETVSQDGWTELAIGLQFTGESTARFDGGSGHGIVIAHQANELAMMHAITTGLGAASVVSSSNCGALALYTRRAAESKLIGIAFSRGQQAPIDDNDDACPPPVITTISIALSDDTGHLVCVDIEDPEILLIGEVGHGERRADSALDRSNEVRSIIRLILEPQIDRSLLQDVLELSDAIEQAGTLFVVVDPTRTKNGIGIVTRLRRKIETVAHRSSLAETLGDPVSTEEVIRRAVGIPISSSAEMQINDWSETLRVAVPFADPDGCPATIQ